MPDCVLPDLERGAPLFLIAGPCVIESEESVLASARAISTMAGEAGIPYVFKASYDKANRTSIESFRGPGLERGLAALARVRAEVGVPVLSDVHQPSECEVAARILDILQIPAFLCRQTDLLVAAARTGKVVNVKKGQFLAPWDMEHVVKKLTSSGAGKVLITERGASFGYNRLVSDMTAIPELQKTGLPVVFDATHSVQLPGGQGSSSGGRREHVATLARAAVAAGCDGIFLEVHEDPDRAKSDGPNMVPLRELPALLRQLQAIREAYVSTRLPLDASRSGSSSAAPPGPGSGTPSTRRSRG
jgi:2-dehydro-3-deoxyphosphooctonate aldolase (KDO 8-P synthase)